MRFKVLGVVMLALGLYLVGEGVVLVRETRDQTALGLAYCLAAIFLAIAARVLQAERHHRVEAPLLEVKAPLPRPESELEAPNFR